jgi:hypothetical protein
MGFYNRFILPQVIELAMRQKTFAPFRERVVGAPRGRMLEIGIGSAVNLASYRSGAEEVYGVDPSIELLTKASQRLNTSWKSTRSSRFRAFCLWNRPRSRHGGDTADGLCAGRKRRSRNATRYQKTMKGRRYCLFILAPVLLAACGPRPPQTGANTVGGANLKFTAQSSLTKSTTSLALDWGSGPHTGQLVIAQVITYGSFGPKISAPTGWQVIRDDASPTTRQTLYWHAIRPNEASRQIWNFSEPVDAQGAMVVLDNVEMEGPVDVATGDSGAGGTVPVKVLKTSWDGDLILTFCATDFAQAPLAPQAPGFMSPVLLQIAIPHEYWIFKTYQNVAAETDEASFPFPPPQSFNWVTSQVAIKHAGLRPPIDIREH